MSGKITIPIPEKHLARLWRMEGASLIQSELEGKRDRAMATPGYELAYQITKGLVADARVEWASVALRIVASAGHNVGTIGAVITTMVDGKPCLQISDEPTLFEDDRP